MGMRKADPEISNQVLRLANFDMARDVVPHFAPIFGCQKSYLVLGGGRGSAKSYSVGELLVYRTVNEPGHLILVGMKVGENHRQATFRQILEIIEKWGITNDFKINHTNLEITFKPNGNQFIFRGGDDVKKWKSIPGITIIWLEEADQFSTIEEFVDIDLTLRKDGKHYNQIILTFNTLSDQHWIYKRFYAKEDPDAAIDISNYLMNPYVSERFVKAMNKLKRDDPALYRVVGLGHWGCLKGLIYDRPWPLRTLSEKPAETIWGIDFGFKNMAVLRDDMTQDEVHYLKEIYCGPCDTTDELMQKLEGWGATRDEVMYADSAEEDRIIQMQRAGWRVVGVEKGKGSVRAGIAHVRASRIFMNGEQPTIEKQRQTYKWREDKYGKVIQPEEPTKYNDHLLDCIRYIVKSYRERNSAYGMGRSKMSKGAVAKRRVAA